MKVKRIEHCNGALSFFFYIFLLILNRMIMEKYFIEDWNPVKGELEDTELYTPSSVVADRRAAKYSGDYESLTIGHIVNWIDLSQFKKRKKGK
jgi:hypothetical protein